MKYKIVLLVVFLLALSLSTAYAGNDKRSGTAGAPELLIPVGSRGTALGGAVLANVSGIESMYWNPAGLASLEGSEVMFMHLPYIADINVNYFGYAKMIEDFGTVGFGAKVINIGDMVETTWEEPNGTGRLFSPTYSVMNLSFAKILTTNVSFGFTGKVIHETIAEVSATGFAFDAGFMYNPQWKGLTMGVVIKNYGTTMSFDGSGFDQNVEQRTVRGNSAANELPSSISFGMAYNLHEDDLNLATFSGTFQSNNFSQDVWNGGLEYVYDGTYSLRAGYNYSDKTEYIYGASFGAGVKFPVGNMELSMEYTWTQTDVFDNNQYFTFKTNF